MQPKLSVFGGQEYIYMIAKILNCYKSTHVPPHLIKKMSCNLYNNVIVIR